MPAHLPEGATIERDGPPRTVGFGRCGWVEYRELGDVNEAELDRLIQAQVARFAERNEPFEWKFHSHDRPSFLEERLTAAGFVAEELETVMIAETAALADGGRTRRRCGARGSRPNRLRADRPDGGCGLGSGGSWYADTLEHELAADPDGLAIFVAEADGVVVSAGWVRFPSGTDFATLWGGATLPEWRGRGIYRALVFRRAGSQPSGGGAIWRSTPQRTAGRSSSGSAFAQSRRRGRTSGRRRPSQAALGVELRLRCSASTRVRCAFASTRSCLASRSARSAFVSFFFAIVFS
jgi:ribosomal protein S18 acetylase RimI-like enzyme